MNPPVVHVVTHILSNLPSGFWLVPLAHSKVGCLSMPRRPVKMGFSSMFVRRHRGHLFTRKKSTPPTLTGPPTTLAARLEDDAVLREKPEAFEETLMVSMAASELQ